MLLVNRVELNPYPVVWAPTALPSRPRPRASNTSEHLVVTQSLSLGEINWIQVESLPHVFICAGNLDWGRFGMKKITGDSHWQRKRGHGKYQEHPAWSILNPHESSIYKESQHDQEDVCCWGTLLRWLFKWLVCHWCDIIVWPWAVGWRCLQ